MASNETPIPNLFNYLGSKTVSNVNTTLPNNGSFNSPTLGNSQSPEKPAVIFTPYIIIAFLVIVFASMVFLYMRNAKIADEEQSSCLDLGHGQEDLEMRNFLIDANRGEEGAHAAVLCEITPTPGSHDADQLKSEVRVVKPPAPAYFEKGTTTRGREFV